MACPFATRRPQWVCCLQMGASESARRCQSASAVGRSRSDSYDNPVRELVLASFAGIVLYSTGLICHRAYSFGSVRIVASDRVATLQPLIAENTIQRKHQSFPFVALATLQPLIASCVRVKVRIRGGRGAGARAVFVVGFLPRGKVCRGHGMPAVDI